MVGFCEIMADPMFNIGAYNSFDELSTNLHPRGWLVQNCGNESQKVPNRPKVFSPLTLFPTGGGDRVDGWWKEQIFQSKNFLCTETIKALFLKVQQINCGDIGVRKNKNVRKPELLTTM